MLTFNDAVSQVLHGTAQTLSDNGFSTVVPEGIKKGELPTQTEGDATFVEFSGDKGTIRFVFSGDQAVLMLAAVAENGEEEELKKASTNYFDLESFDERDIKSLCNEFNETVNSRFAKAKAKTKSAKMPTPVSRSAAKSGSQSYDGNTLVNRLTGMYPDLKEPYHENYERYGEFLAEEFFTEYGTKRVIDTIREGNRQACNKLFRILNDIYENGSNDTQSLIAVTILGEMQNDPQLLETAKEYMCEDMSETVVLVNKYLASSAGKRAQKKLLDPPPYKPKKQKKPSAFAQALAGGGQGMPPTM